MKTLFGQGGGCATCLEDRPSTKTIFIPGGSQIRLEECDQCGKVWGVQELTEQQAVLLDTTAEAGRVFTSLGSSLNENVGSARYDKVMEEIATLYGAEVCELIRETVGAIGAAIARSHRAGAAETAQHRKPGTTS